MVKKITGKSANDKLANAFVTMTANLQRLSANESLIVQGVLKSLEQDIVSKLHDNPDMTTWRKSRYNALLSQTRDTIKTAYTSISDHHHDSLTQMAGLGVAGAEKIMSSVGLPLQSVILTQEQLRGIANASLVHGAPNRVWWAKQSQSLQDSFMEQMRIGYASGETIDQLVQRVRGTATGKKSTYVINGKTKVYSEFTGGIMDVGTRQAEALVRTATQQIAADAKMLSFQKNADIIKGVMWLSTLDSRTTPLCRARDGLLYGLDGKPMGHDVPFLGGPPAHWSCRSTLVPVTKSFEELGATPGVTKEYLDTIGDGTRASMDGQVPASLSFDSWFNTLPEEDQMSFLGPKKYKIWKNAGLNFTDMVDQRGNPLTLAQLGEAYGYKIEESALSGIPNVPKEIVSAIAVEQEAQALASQMLAEAAHATAQEAEAALLALAKSPDMIEQNVYVQTAPNFDPASPVKNLAVVQAKIAEEAIAAEQYKAVQDDVVKVLFSGVAKDSDEYIDAMQKKIALNDSVAVLPSQKLIEFETKLAQLNTTNAAISAELDLQMAENPLFDALDKQFFIAYKEAHGAAPVWDMRLYSTELEAFIAKKEAQAMELLTVRSGDDMVDAISVKAMQKAKEEVPQGLKGSASATLEKKDKYQYEIAKAEVLEQKKLTDFVEWNDGAKEALEKAKAGTTGLTLPSELLQKTKIEFDKLQDAAVTEFASIFNNAADSAEIIAWNKYKNSAYYSSQASPITHMKFYKKTLSEVQAEMAKAVSHAAKDMVGVAPISGNIAQIGSMTFDLSTQDGMIAYKTQKGNQLTKYKWAIIEGKAPSETAQSVYASLSYEEKAAFDATLAQSLKQVPPITSNAVPSSGALQMAQMEQIGKQKGSNVGGFYRDRRTGVEYYIKFPDSEDVARNEHLASKLYQAAGVDVPELTLINDSGRIGLASKVKPGLVQGDAKGLGEAIGAGNGYAVDAWLANWDVVGLSYDNLLLTEAGTAFRVDVGGSLRYRAMGGLKGQAFGKTVDDLDTLRDPKINPNSANVFGKIKVADLEAGVKKVLSIPDEKIRHLVAEFGPVDSVAATDLADTLIARKQDLARRFPHIASPATVPAPVDIKALVSPRDVSNIERGRINGYALPADRDMIEDQSIRMWVEKGLDGEQYTGVRFKFTQFAERAVNEKLRRLITDAGMDFDAAVLKQNFETFQKQMHFQWNLPHNKQGLILAKELAEKNLAELEKAYASVVKNAEAFDTNFAKSFVDMYAQPMKDIKRILSKEVLEPVGTIKAGKWQDTPAGKMRYNAVRNVNIPEAKEAPAGLVFERKPAQFYKKELKNGYAVQTDAPLRGTEYGGTWKEVYEATTPDGIRVRVWLGDEMGGRALGNQVEVLTKGADTAAMTRALKLIEDELGISVTRPDALAQEEMYLRMIARHRGQWSAIDAADKMIANGAPPSERVDALKQALTEVYGRNVTKLKGYNPQGVYEAFETGARRWYLPEVDTDKKWKSFRESHVLRHQITGGSDISTVLDNVLSGGGTMTTTVDKLRRGIDLGGMSPASDMLSGGADYFFTRILKKGTAGADYPGLFWNTRQLARLDTISYSADRFGSTSESVVRHQGLSSIAEYKEAAKSVDNETIFKNGLSLFDGLEKIVCPDPQEAAKVLEVLTKHGWGTTWVDGRPTLDLIFVRDLPYKPV